MCTTLIKKISQPNAGQLKTPTQFNSKQLSMRPTSSNINRYYISGKLAKIPIKRRCSTPESAPPGTKQHSNMSLTKETIDDTLSDLFYEFGAEEGIQFDGAPVKLDLNTILDYVSEQNNKLFRIIRIAAGVALIKGENKIIKEHLEMAARIDTEGFYPFGW